MLMHWAFTPFIATNCLTTRVPKDTQKVNNCLQQVLWHIAQTSVNGLHGMLPSITSLIQNGKECFRIHSRLTRFASSLDTQGTLMQGVQLQVTVVHMHVVQPNIGDLCIQAYSAKPVKMHLFIVLKPCKLCELADVQKLWQC